MARERELDGWCEDAQLARVVAVDEDRLAEPKLVRDALSVILADQRTVDHSKGVALATSIVGEHTEHSDKHVVLTAHGIGLALGIGYWHGPAGSRPRRSGARTRSRRSPRS
jgi:hypothetical protein